VAAVLFCAAPAVWAGGGSPEVAVVGASVFAA
jgi:hypothetical protein